jgi:hypothetical protein
MGNKYKVFEGGIRIPFMMRWPRALPGGGHYPYVVSTLDILPTVADPGDPSLDVRTLFWRWQGSNYAVRRGPWKLIDSETGRSALLFTDEIYFDYGIVGKKSLINLEESPSETTANDRIDEEPVLADELKALYDAWVNSL